MFRFKFPQRIVYLAASAGLLSASHNVANCRQGGTTNHHMVSSGTYPANNPIEDRHIAYKKVREWDVSAVFDGHGGWNVSEFAMTNLLDILERNLSSINPPTSQIAPSKSIKVVDEAALDEAITKSFDDCEQKYVNSIRSAYQLGFGSVASVGSCVLVAMKHNEHLVLANCGDCRAVLGSISKVSTASSVYSNGPILATRLTRDHNSREPLEAAAMQRAHPTEELADLIRCKHEHACYVKGRLQLTRSLGDLYLKDSEFNAPEGSHRSRFASFIHCL